MLGAFEVALIDPTCTSAADLTAHVLVLGHDGPMAYVILASSEREIEDVIRAIGDALPRTG